MNIKKKDFVLEVGSGDKPYDRSDILVDKYFDDAERERLRPLIIDRPFVLAEGEHLPFTNKLFDYVIASHVLEHADNPAHFLNELSRVGKRGYIETPSAIRERVYNWSFHKWYLIKNGNVLTFIRKTKKSNKLFGKLTKRKRQLIGQISQNINTNLAFEWSDKISYRIVLSEPKNFLQGLDKTLTDLFKQALKKRGIDNINKFKVPFYHSLVVQIKKQLYRYHSKFKTILPIKKRHTIDIYSIIICPQCKGKLLLKNKSLQCSSCKRKYVIEKKNIPNLLINN